MSSKQSKKKLLAICSTLTVVGTLLITPTTAETISKQLEVFYRNISVSVNGKEAALKQEPFINKIDSSVYIPLRAFAEMTGSEVSWDSKNNKVTVSEKKDPSKDLEIAKLNHELLLLKQQLVATTSELEKYKNNETSETTDKEDFSQLLKNLHNDYKDELDIRWKFDLSKSKNGIELEVYYDSRYDKDSFDDLSRRSLLFFVEDLTSDIQKVFKRVEITGTIIDTRYDLEQATFSRSNTGATKLELKKDLYGDLLDKLKRDYRYLEGLSFRLPITGFELEERNGTLIFTVLTNLRPNSTSNLSDDWNAIKDSPVDTRHVKTFMEDVAYDIGRVLDIDIEGFIRDEYSKDITCSFDGRNIVIRQTR